MFNIQMLILEGAIPTKTKLDDNLQDDGSGRQQYQVTRNSYGGYNLHQVSGRAGCNTFLSAQTCGISDYLIMAATNTSQLSSFQILPIPIPRLFPDGVYQIQNTERAACASVLNASSCANGNAIAMNTTGAHTAFLLTKSIFFADINCHKRSKNKSPPWLIAASCTHPSENSN